VRILRRQTKDIRLKTLDKRHWMWRC